MSASPATPPLASSHLQSWSLFIWIAAALVVGVMSTALVSPLYPIYQAEFSFSHAEISYIHIIYMAGVMTALLFLGNLNNYFGYWIILRVGLGITLLGLALMALVPSLWGLMTGRFLIGISSGMLTTSTMLGLVQTIPPVASARASQYASIINVTGFGLGPLAGGIIAEYFFFPLVMPFVVMAIAAIGVSLRLQQHGQQMQAPRVGRLSVLPQMGLPDAQVRRVFWTISLGAFIAFGIFSFFASLATSFLQEFLRDAGPLINGAAVASVLLVSGLVQFSAKSLAPRRSFIAGVMVLIMACALLIVTIIADAAWLLFLTVILAGVGHGLTLVASFGRLHEISSPDNKSQVLSTFLFVGYLGMIIPIIVSGYVSDWFGLNTGVVVFYLMMLALAIGVLLRTINYKTAAQT